MAVLSVDVQEVWERGRVDPPLSWFRGGSWRPTRQNPISFGRLQNHCSVAHGNVASYHERSMVPPGRMW